MHILNDSQLLNHIDAKMEESVRLLKYLNPPLILEDPRRDIIYDGRTYLDDRSWI
jgi:hypothetical protein